MLCFTGGGTGGHIYPNLALAQELRQKYPKLNLTYLGSQGRLEARLAHENQLEFIQIPFIGGMPRNPGALIWLFRLLAALWEVYWLLRKNRPTMIFGTGGYSSAPVFAAALLLRIPYIIHNLDTYIGLANQLFIPGASALTLGMPPAGHGADYPRPKNGPVVLTGNPIRSQFLSPPIDPVMLRENLGLKPDLPVLVVIGGSQGAQIINENLFAILDDLLAENWQIIHQLGEKQYASFEERFPKHAGYKPHRYLNEVWEVYQVADMAISRGGAMSIAELTSMGLPALYIPLAKAAQNHQELNVRYLVGKGAAEILLQKELTPLTLKRKIEEVYRRRADLREKLKPLQEGQQSSTQKLLGVMRSFLGNWGDQT